MQASKDCVGLVCVMLGILVFFHNGRQYLFALHFLTAGVLVSQAAGRGDGQAAEEPKQKTKGNNESLEFLPLSLNPQRQNEIGVALL